MKHQEPTIRVRQEVHVGDIVLIKEEGVPRGTWKFGGITSVNPSNDARVRSATALIPSKEQEKNGYRPVSLLYPVEYAKEEIAENTGRRSTVDRKDPSKSSRVG